MASCVTWLSLWAVRLLLFHWRSLASRESTYLPSKQTHQGINIRWSDIDTFSDIISQMAWIFLHLRLNKSCVVRALTVQHKMQLLCRCRGDDSMSEHNPTVKVFPTMRANKTITDLGPDDLLFIPLKPSCEKTEEPISRGVLAPSSIFFKKRQKKSTHMYNLYQAPEAALSKTFTSPSRLRNTLSSVTQACHVSPAVLPLDISTLISTRASTHSFFVLQSFSNMSF